MAPPESAPPAAGRRLRRRRGTALSLALATAGAVAIASRGLRTPAPAALGLGDGGESYTLVLLRHGESQWNLENRFTGWVDVDVTEQGADEAREAGRLLKEADIEVDMAFTSLQKRAIKTLALALEVMDLLWIPVTKSWRLNERMYGDLQGMNKAETTEKFGEEKVTEWRRSYAIPPPPIADDNPYHPKLEAKYASIPKDDMPVAESLELTVQRVIPFWKHTIAPAIKEGNKIIIAAHGNSLRALVKYLDDIPDDKIIKLNIPTAVPLVYKLDKRLKPIKVKNSADGLSGAFLGDPAWVDGKINGVANQAKAR